MTAPFCGVQSDASDWPHAAGGDRELWQMHPWYAVF